MKSGPFLSSALAAESVAAETIVEEQDGIEQFEGTEKRTADPLLSK